VAVWCAGCAAPLVKLPAGPGTPASDAADALTDAIAACRAVSTLSAEVGVGGSVGGRRVRGSLLVGVAPPASARIEAVAPAGQPIFIFVANGDDATLLLPRDNRVLLHGRPDAVLEAVAGPPLDAVELRETLTGCVLPAGGATGRQLGGDWRVVSVGSTDVYLHRNAQLARWQGLERVGVGSVELIPVAAPDHPLALAGRNMPGAGREHIQLVLTDRSTLTQGQDFGVIGTQTWRLADLGSKHTLLKEGIGWGYMPEPMVREELEKKQLVRLDMPECNGASIRLHAIYQTDTPPGPAVSWLIGRFVAQAVGKSTVVNQLPKLLSHDRSNRSADAR